MIGAKVNNRIVPIDHGVVTGEIIEIITGLAKPWPPRDWLNIVRPAKQRTRSSTGSEGAGTKTLPRGKDAFEKELRRNLMVIREN